MPHTVTCDTLGWCETLSETLQLSAQCSVDAKFSHQKLINNLLGPAPQHHQHSAVIVTRDNVPQPHLLSLPAQVPAGEEPGGAPGQDQEEQRPARARVQAGREAAEQRGHVRGHHRVRPGHLLLRGR